MKNLANYKIAWNFLNIVANFADSKICLFYAEFYTKNYAELEMCKFYVDILISVALIQIRNFQSGYQLFQVVYSYFLVQKAPIPGTKLKFQV